MLFSFLSLLSLLMRVNEEREGHIIHHGFYERVESKWGESKAQKKGKGAKKKTRGKKKKIGFLCMLGGGLQ